MSIRSNSLQHIAASVGHARIEDSPGIYALEPQRVLIIDDPQSTQSLELLLRELGYWTTRVAASGAAALQLVQKYSPSLVFLALDLPDMSAYDVAWRLRERCELRRVRLIALTGDYEHTYRDLARRAGFERFLAKPVSRSVLRGIVCSVPYNREPN